MKIYIILCTRKGIIKKTLLEAYSRPRQSGIIAININEGDELLEAKMTNGRNEVMLALRSGRAIRFPEEKVRPMGRSAAGVKGITLSKPSDEVVGMVCVENGDFDILVVSENGYGKRSRLEDYRVTNRGGKGIKTINITAKTGQLIAIKEVRDTDDLMITNRSGLLIRLGGAELRVMGRATQGVRLEDIAQDSERAGGVIRRLRALFNKTGHERSALQLNDIIQETLDLLRTEVVLKGLTTQVHLEPALPGILGNRIELQQVVLNLVVNAMEAMSECEPGQRQLQIATSCQESREIRDSIRDSGPGIRVQPISRLFEPFFTTKANGMGMGLAISQSILEAHDGSLWAVNNPDRGATFHLTLPIHHGNPHEP